MEKHLYMKFIKLCALALPFWLVGCATVSSPTSGDAITLSTSRELGGQLKPQEGTPPRTAQSAKTPRLLETFESAPFTSIQLRPSQARTVVALAPPADLWDRIRRGYAMPDLENDLVHDREQWYASKPDYIFRMTARSKKYLFHVVEELEVRNMPTELALLPFIESAFNPQAVSSAKAAGMWQFMPATGKYFDLKQNAFRDDRRDVLASTHAALGYLQKLYGMFDDWHLALAAYNWGEGSVRRAIAKNKGLGLPTGYLDLNMPMETRFYVPKLQAIKNIVSGSDAFNATLPLIENHPYFQSVTISRDIDVALAAQLAEVPLEDFKALNPSMNRPVIMAAGTPQILLPWDNAAIFQSNLDGYTGGRMASWTVWIAPTTMRTADIARRVGMSESELRRVNNIPPRVVIRAGSSLLVPRSEHMRNDVTEKVADGGQISVAPEVTLQRITVRAGKKDNVATLARKYRTTAANVAEWNKVKESASFKPGQQVVVYVPVSNRSKASNTSASKKSRPGRVAKR
jgi:membrane-bound lytic murein transglycosylase D